MGSEIRHLIRHLPLSLCPTESFAIFSELDTIALYRQTFDLCRSANMYLARRAVIYGVIVSGERLNERILAAANGYDKFGLAVRGMIYNIMVQMLSSNGALVNKYMTDTDAKRSVFPVIAKSNFDKIVEAPQLNLV